MGGILKYTLLLMSLIAMSLVSGCASKSKDLSQDFEKAETAIQAAQTAEAESYAPLDLRIAQDKLTEAKAVVNDESHEKARMLTEEAAITAKLAETKTESEKAKKATAKVRESIEGLSDAIQKTQ